MSVIATLVLGGAVAYDLSRPRTKTIATSASATGGGQGVDAGAQASDTTDAGNTAVTIGPANASAGTATGASAGTAQAGTAGSASSGPKATTGAKAAPAGQLSTGTEGVSADTITVGGIYDETGPLDATVERDTVRAYFNKVNAAGGVNGKKFQLIECDSGYDPAKAHACAQRLLSQGVLGIVGSASASGEQAETLFFNQQGVPVIGEIGMKHPEIVVVNVPFIKPVEDAVLKSLHDHGIKEASVEEVDATKPDYTDLAIKIRSEGSVSTRARPTSSTGRPPSVRTH